MPRKRLPKNFIAIDGEAVDGRYVLLCSSDGKMIWADDELSTMTCFEYLIRLKRRSPKGSVFVAFGLNYDVNMMLRDIPRHKLIELWTYGECRVSLEGYAFQLRWIPRKMFELYSPDLRTKIKVYDVFGFFQSSFVKALAAWGIDDPNEAIKEMKTERARFTLAQRKEIEQYCLDECKKLVELCNALEASLLSAGIKLRSYMGAGSVAGALLAQKKVKSHHAQDDEFPEEIKEAIYCAYFGGRVEQCLQGILTNVVGYDVRSAYPAQSLALPSLAGGSWRKAKAEEIHKPGLNAIWQVEWEKAKGDVMPFPLRQKDAEIYFPRNGRGWYHHIEVRAAMLLHAESIRVLRGFVFEPICDDKPFAFVREYYALRAEAKARGDASEKAFKLGLNSLYGKLAQGISSGGLPPFRSLFWAGRITAGTRARMLDAASLHPHGVVSIATDGIVFSGDPGIEESSELGGWERQDYSEIFAAQSGIYWAKKPDGTEIHRTRGFFLKEVDFDDLREGWLNEGIFYAQRGVCECGHSHPHSAKCDSCKCKKFSPRRRFVGLGAALMRSDFGVWRTWAETDRVLKLHSSRKFYDHEETSRVMRLHPPEFPSIIDSVPYVPKGHTLPLTQELRDLIELHEQPSPEA